jgi:3-oxoadipate enol-lactonase
MPHAKICGTDIFYQVTGEGEETLVILNGIMMSTASWDLAAGAFSQAGYRVLCVDFRDQGQSGSSDKPYKIEQHADDLKALLDYLDLPKCHLLGLSYGGQAAMIFALRYPEYINKLILSNTTGSLTNHLRAIGAAWDEAAKLGDGVRFFKLAMPSIYSAKFYEKNYQWLMDREAVMGLQLTSEWFERYLRLSSSHGAYDVTEEVKHIKLPVLLIAGELDGVTPISEMRKLHGAIENSAFIIIADSGHTACYEKPAEFHLAVVGFLKT